MHPLTVVEDLNGCTDSARSPGTEGNQLLETGTGLDWTPPAARRRALTLWPCCIVFFVITHFLLTIYCISCTAALYFNLVFIFYNPELPLRLARPEKESTCLSLCLLCSSGERFRVLFWVKKKALKLLFLGLIQSVKSIEEVKDKCLGLNICINTTTGSFKGWLKPLICIVTTCYCVKKQAGFQLLLWKCLWKSVHVA